jgi:hypothetical protein
MIDEEVEVEVDETTEDQVDETTEDQVEEEEAEDETEEEDDSSEEDDDDDEVEVTIGDPPKEEEEKQETPKWVKTLRKVNRKQEAELKRLRRELEQRSTAQNEPEIQLGEKPTLKSVKYDDKKYEEELQKWYDRKRQIEEREASKQKLVEEQKKKWQTKQEAYATSKTEHGFKDFDDAEELVTNTLDVTQQGIIVQGAKDSALLVYALGRNPEVLDELSKITDPVEFSFKVAKIEDKLNVRNKKAPAPEKRISSGKPGGSSGSKDATLERLRKEAEKTGDYSKVAAYKRKKKRSQ